MSIIARLRQDIRAARAEEQSAVQFLRETPVKLWPLIPFAWIAEQIFKN